MTILTTYEFLGIPIYTKKSSNVYQRFVREYIDPSDNLPTSTFLDVRQPDEVTISGRTSLLVLNKNLINLANITVGSPLFRARYSWKPNS